MKSIKRFLSKKDIFHYDDRYISFYDKYDNRYTIVYDYKKKYFKIKKNNKIVSDNITDDKEVINYIRKLKTTSYSDYIDDKIRDNIDVLGYIEDCYD